MTERRRTEGRSAALPATEGGAGPAEDGLAQRARARRTLAGRARDAADLALLMDMLDLHPRADARARPVTEPLETGRPPGSAFPR
ncbi:hypothetical protein ACFV3R_26985 [Streptomyces sp. NPDC059740]|uniref:hypothetical protein n=1 Tax=Streptomyces sp. NPDC059740 TaxID=3346926 RepID=UPI00365E982B